METRKKRATELIEKCDMKVLSSTERTQVVQIYDRRVKIGLGESILENMSLYSAVRSWVQDDPDKPQLDNIRVGKVRHPAPFVAEDISLGVKRRDDDFNDNILSADSKPEDFERQLSAHIRNFKKIRRRHTVNSAVRYAKSVVILDEMKMPRLMTMVKILRDEERRSISERNRNREAPVTSNSDCVKIEIGDVEDLSETTKVIE